MCPWSDFKDALGRIGDGYLAESFPWGAGLGLVTNTLKNLGNHLVGIFEIIAEKISRFQMLAGVTVKGRYGYGRLSWNSPQKTTVGVSNKDLKVCSFVGPFPKDS